MSLGGGVAQWLAVTAPDRVRTLTLASTSPAGPYDGPPLPGPEPRLSAGGPVPGPDWQDRTAVLAYRVAVERPCAGLLGFDEPRVRRLAALEVDRTTDMAASLTNLVLLGDGWPPGARPADVRAPTLVLHGTTDPLFPLEHGRALARALARAVPGARLVELAGVGHEQPRPSGGTSCCPPCWSTRPSGVPCWSTPPSAQRGRTGQARRVARTTTSSRVTTRPPGPSSVRCASSAVTTSHAVSSRRALTAAAVTEAWAGGACPAWSCP